MLVEDNRKISCMFYKTSLKYWHTAFPYASILCILTYELIFYVDAIPPHQQKVKDFPVCLKYTLYCVSGAE